MGILRRIKDSIIPGQQQDQEDQRPRYLPQVPIPAPPDLTGTDTRGPVYDPPVPQPATQQPEPQTMAARYMATATPMEDTTRPRTVAPPTQAPGTRVIYETKKGQQVPVRAEGGATDDENNQAYLAALEAYKPQNHNSRGKSGLINFGRAYLQGHGLVGATIAGIGGLVDPSSDERYANERQISSTTRAVGQAAAQRKAASDLANEQARRDQEAAQTERTLHPVYEPKLIQMDDGTYANLTPGQDTAKPVYNPAGPDGVRTPFKGKVPPDKLPKPEIRHNEKTGKAEKWLLGTDGEPDKKVEGWSDPKQDLVKTKFGWVAPGTALTADATASNQTRQRTRDAKTDANRDEDKNQAQIDKQTKAQADFAKLAGDIDEHKRNMMEIDAKLHDPVSGLYKALNEAKPEDKPAIQKEIAGLESDFSRYKSLGAGSASELSKMPNSIYEAGIGERGFPYYKIKPFSVKAWRNVHKNESKETEDKAIQNAKAAEMPIVK